MTLVPSPTPVGAFDARERGSVRDALLVVLEQARPHRPLGLSRCAAPPPRP
ncbi:hypothetical protein ACIBJF_30585 [Streptomyces sp. NPDC050743]|uniref:hypothetical protein n=1 Tax=Streptomyces sp. NPDC050743 TaxID=3365634 RepID=UPI0037A0A92C